MSGFDVGPLGIGELGASPCFLEEGYRHSMGVHPFFQLSGLVSAVSFEWGPEGVVGVPLAKFGPGMGRVRVQGMMRSCRGGFRGAALTAISRVLGSGWYRLVLLPAG